MARCLWTPSPERVSQANLTRFISFINQRTGAELKNYFELYDWSLRDIPGFWAALWDFGEVIHSSPYTQVVDDPEKLPGAKWFKGAKLNFAENLLKYKDGHTAVIFSNEKGETSRMTYAELYRRSAHLAAALKGMGVSAGDRVAGFTPNIPEAIIAMLASACLGAVWSSCSPDFGFQGVMDRFGQIRPKVLFTADAYHWTGKTFPCLDRVARVKAEIDSIEKVIVMPYAEEDPDISGVPDSVLLTELIPDGPAPDMEFAQLPFDHPLYILYSSGTTGVPKCMVHGAGGTLLAHIKESCLHSDVKREDRIFYFTTCGWMMWHWLVSSLAQGATVMLYDGSPFHPDPSVLFRLVQDEGMTIFGTSARYIAAIENEGLEPGKDHDLSSLKAMLSTGSPLSVESFHYVYDHIKKDICLSSISGGSDIVGCFALGNPIGPVYEGQLQCRGLGVAMEAWSTAGRPLVGEKGELVCTKPMVNMPVFFWNDPDGKKYHDAYFDTFPNVWHHGDFCEVTEEGGVIIYGRSDATLNPGGVRIGTAEIYRQVEGLEEIADSLVVGQEWQNDVRIVLFVKLNSGYVLDEALIKKIKTGIRMNCSPRHMPAVLAEVADIPYTISGKKVELAVRNVIHGREVLNKDALANPEALDLYIDLEVLKS